MSSQIVQCDGCGFEHEADNLVACNYCYERLCPECDDKHECEALKGGVA